MRIFFDSSAFIKRFIEEQGSGEVDELCLQASSLALSDICYPEIMSALNRKVREGILLKSDYLMLKQEIIDDMQDIVKIALTQDVLACAVSLLEQNALRSLDALHLASARIWNAELFVSADKRQLEAAKKMKFAIRFIG